MGIVGSQIAGEEKKYYLTVWQGFVEHVCKSSGSISWNQRWSLDFRVEFTHLAFNYFVSV